MSLRTAWPRPNARLDHAAATNPGRALTPVPVVKIGGSAYKWTHSDGKKSALIARIFPRSARWPEEEMSRSVTRQMRSAAWRKCWASIASRHARASEGEPGAKKERRRGARIAATRARKAARRASSRRSADTSAAPDPARPTNNSRHSPGSPSPSTGLAARPRGQPASRAAPWWRPTKHRVCIPVRRAFVHAGQRGNEHGTGRHAPRVAESSSCETRRPCAGAGLGEGVARCTGEAGPAGPLSGMLPGWHAVEARARPQLRRLR